MDIIGLLMEVWNTGFWGSIIGWFYDFIGNYGWTIIVFTIALKICLLPLDFFQRRSARKNAEMQKIVQPELEKIKAKYANQPDKMQQKLNEKQMEVFKKHNYNVMGSCLVMVLNMAITMVVFFTLFASLGTIANKQISNQFEALNNQYIESMTSTADLTQAEASRQEALNSSENIANADKLYNDLIAEGKTTEEATTARTEYLNDLADTAYLNSILATGNKEEAQEAVLELWDSGEVTESWLWVKNVWKGDTATSSVPTYNEYKSMSGNNDTALTEEQYNDVMAKVVEAHPGWNGYYILIVLSGAITLLSQLIMTGAFKKKDDSQKIPGSKFLMIFLPAIMIIFTLSTNAIFALYVCVNALMSMIITPLFNLIFDAMDKHKKKKSENEVLVDYKIEKFK